VELPYKVQIRVLEQTQDLPISLKEAWDFFSTPRNLDEITPDDLGFKIKHLPDEFMYQGQIITYQVMIFPGIWMPWVTEIKAVEEQKQFVDEQRFGPYSLWHHLHRFEKIDGGVRMLDRIHYAVGLGSLSLGPVSHLLNKFMVRPKLERVFNYRKKILTDKFGHIESHKKR